MLPFWQRAIFFVLAPPVMACLTWLMMRGWAMGVQGGRVSERTVRRQRVEFWVLLAVMYAIAFAVAVYAAVMR